MASLLKDYGKYVLSVPALMEIYHLVYLTTSNNSGVPRKFVSAKVAEEKLQRRQPLIQVASSLQKCFVFAEPVEKSAFNNCLSSDAVFVDSTMKVNGDNNIRTFFNYDILRKIDMVEQNEHSYIKTQVYHSDSEICIVYQNGDTEKEEEEAASSGSGKKFASIKHIMIMKVDDEHNHITRIENWWNSTPLITAKSHLGLGHYLDGKRRVYSDVYLAVRGKFADLKSAPASEETVLDRPQSKRSLTTLSVDDTSN